MLDPERSRKVLHVYGKRPETTHPTSVLLGRFQRQIRTTIERFPIYECSHIFSFRLYFGLKQQNVHFVSKYSKHYLISHQLITLLSSVYLCVSSVSRVNSFQL